jgi:hypothetical protein
VASLGNVLEAAYAAFPARLLGESETGFPTLETGNSELLEQEKERLEQERDNGIESGRF